MLQGSLCVSSTTISPSSIAHPILAPTSHPIPVLSPSPVSRKSTASTLLDRLDLPSTFIETSPQAVFLIREHHCGLEGLRHGAVPGFAHTWLTEAGLWGLRNIHPVSALHFGSIITLNDIRSLGPSRLPCTLTSPLHLGRKLSAPSLRQKKRKISHPPLFLSRDRNARVNPHLLDQLSTSF